MTDNLEERKNLWIKHHGEVPRNPIIRDGVPLDKIEGFDINDYRDYTSTLFKVNPTFHSYTGGTTMLNMYLSIGREAAERLVLDVPQHISQEEFQKCKSVERNLETHGLLQKTYRGGDPDYHIENPRIDALKVVKFLAQQEDMYKGINPAPGTKIREDDVEELLNGPQVEKYNSTFGYGCYSLPGDKNKLIYENEQLLTEGGQKGFQKRSCPNEEDYTKYIEFQKVFAKLADLIDKQTRYQAYAYLLSANSPKILAPEDAKEIFKGDEHDIERLQEKLKQMGKGDPGKYLQDSEEKKYAEAISLNNVQKSIIRKPAISKLD